MPKIAFIGGGSGKFVREVMVDLLSFPTLANAHVTLMDIDHERVNRSERVVKKMIADQKLPATVESTTDQRKAVAGADYIIITIMVGGFKHYHSDVAIPEKYGVTQAVSDTIGPGGVFRTVRTTPVLAKLVRDVKELAPHAWIINYANPMAMNVWTLTQCGHQKTVGLCHSIQGCYRYLAWLCGVNGDEVKYTAAGINHINFYLTLQHQGHDLYPILKAKAADIIKERPRERVRFELLEHLGYFPAEGPDHQTEYYPWFRKNKPLVDHYAVETYWGYNVDLEHFNRRKDELEKQISGAMPISYNRSGEYAGWIIDALQGGLAANTPVGNARMIYGNVPNRGLIENLPPQAIVEVPCLVDVNGITPCRMSRIPPQLAAVINPHVAVHEMAVNGTLEKDRRLIELAIQADPLTGAVLTLPQIRDMVRELFEENKEYTADWK